MNDISISSSRPFEGENVACILVQIGGAGGEGQLPPVPTALLRDPKK